MPSYPNLFTNAIDGVTEIEAAHLNNLEAKVGLDNSITPGSIDYQLRNSASVDPGHKHTAGAFTGGFDGDVFFRDPADHLWKPVGPDSASLVAKTGAQSIAGVKTFTSIPILPVTDPTAPNEATRKGYVDAQDALKVAKAGDTMSGPLAMGGQNITGVGTLAAATAQLTNPLAAIYGGTGQAVYEVGDLLFASTTTALSRLADIATGNVLISGGVGVAPSWGKADLTAHITGVLPVANGGTGGATGWTAGLDPGHKHSKMWSSDGAIESVTIIASGDVGLGKSPDSRLHVYHLTNDARIRIETDKVDGIASLRYTNDARTYSTRISSNDRFQIRDVTADLARLSLDSAGNFGLYVETFGLSSAMCLGMGAGTLPTADYPVNMAHMGVVDQAPGNACFHFVTELGHVIKLYRQAHIANLNVAYGAGDLDTEAELITAFNTTNGVINTLLTYLENLGFNATS